jgi:hypothetical protein
MLCPPFFESNGGTGFKGWEGRKVLKFVILSEATEESHDFEKKRDPSLRSG